jgi:hypothetical protein
MYYGGLKVIKTFLVNNTPKSYKFKSNIRQGSISENLSQHSVITPYELGIEKSHTVIKCEPIEGHIASYS